MNDDELGLYLEAIGQYKLLSADEEAALAARIKQGDKQAEQDLVNANLRLVVKIANKFTNRSNAPDLMELIQVGNVHLIADVKGFNPDLGYRFSTYAWPRIYGHLQNYFRKNNFFIDDSISLDSTFQDDGDTLGSIQADPNAVMPEEYVIEKERVELDLELIKKVIKSLSERERQILTLYYGLDGNSPMTLRQVGKQFGVSFERVQQIIARVVEKVRQADNMQEFLSDDLAKDLKEKEKRRKINRQSRRRTKDARKARQKLEKLGSNGIEALKEFVRVGNLTPRQAEAVNLRYGLIDGITRSLREVDIELGTKRGNSGILLRAALRKFGKGKSKEQIEQDRKKKYLKRTKEYKQMLKDEAAKRVAKRKEAREKRKADEEWAKQQRLQQSKQDVANAALEKIDFKLEELKEFINNKNDLTERQVKIMRLRFGLDDGIFRSHWETAKQLGEKNIDKGAGKVFSSEKSAIHKFKQSLLGITVETKKQAHKEKRKQQKIIQKEHRKQQRLSDDAKLKGIDVKALKQFVMKGSLTPLQDQVIRLRYGLDDNISRSLQEVGDIIGSYDRNVGKIEQRALQKFRQFYGIKPKSKEEKSADKAKLVLARIDYKLEDLKEFVHSGGELTETQEKIIRLQFGIDDGIIRTDWEVCKELGTGMGTVKQSGNYALKKFEKFKGLKEKDRGNGIGE